jgi:carotenoid cleavage dioxygenase
VTNPYLEGHFAPLQQEHTLTDLEVTGNIPDYLDGRYVRNGPNPIGELDPPRHHWFLGDGMVHGIRIRDAKAEWYRNRWVRGPRVAKALGERSPVRHFGTVPIGPNTNVIGHAGKTLALMESGVATYELTDELETVGKCDFDGTVTGGYTAHPKRDPETGELHGVAHSPYRGNRVQYSVIGVDGRARRTVDIEVAGGPMMDNLSLTERHVVFYDLPVTFDARRAAAPARSAGAVGLGRQGPHPGSDHREAARFKDLRPPVPLLVESQASCPRWCDATRRQQRRRSLV